SGTVSVCTFSRPSDSVQNFSDSSIDLVAMTSWLIFIPFATLSALRQPNTDRCVFQRSQQTAALRHRRHRSILKDQLKAFPARVPADAILRPHVCVRGPYRPRSEKTDTSRWLRRGLRW